MVTTDDFRRFADRVRELTGGIPIGFKLSANHVERDMQFAIDASASSQAGCGRPPISSKRSA